MRKFKKLFRGLADPRAANARHELWEVLFIALAAVLCGAKSCCEIALFGRSKEAFLREFMALEYGIPSHDTFSRVFRLLDPQAFEEAFRRFMAAFAKANGITLTGVVSIDGKALRGAYERGKSATPLHMVNVFAAEARMVLAARQAPGRNEAKGALEVLGMLALEGCLVTADALHCNRPFAATVRKLGGDFVLALKRNQSKLFDAVERRFGRGGKRSVAKQRQSSTHDRHEWRRATIIRDTSVAAANLSRCCCPGSRHVASPTPGRTSREDGRPLLSALLLHVRQTTAADRAQSLGYRELLALGAGYPNDYALLSENL
jgi:predicted transposase YbfD/YdcC